jgi:manganese transport protein
VFVLALLASGFSSSIVAVMAGEAIMQGFVSFRVPLWPRRLIVIAPSFIVVAAGIDMTNALVLSQVVLSLALPIPMVALVKFTARRDVMGEFANSRLTNVLAVAAAGFVCLLNGVLLLVTAAKTIPTTLVPRTVKRRGQIRPQPASVRCNVAPSESGSAGCNIRPSRQKNE